MNAFYRLTWIVSRVTLRTYFHGAAYGAEHVPREGGVILAANHASYLDPPLIGGSLDRDIHYLARESLFSIRSLRWALRLLQCVPVDRDGGGAKGLRMILDRLLGGAGIILFPEGTRTPNGALQPARAGIGLAVIKSTAPVVPVRIFGSYEAFSRYAFLPKPRRIVIKFGESMDFAAERAEAASCSKARLKELYQWVADTLMQRIAAMDPHPPDRGKSVSGGSVR